jgi:ribonuclease T1
MKKIYLILLFALGVFLFQDGAFDQYLDRSPNSASSGVSSSLSQQEQNLHRTLALIKQGGPYPYSRDGITFENRERRLPIKPMGYYREFTVDTPGLTHRGPRRVVTGGNPPEVFYYTEDHYSTFRRITPP